MESDLEISFSPHRKYVEKGWGGEDWIWNQQYCGKRLYFHRGKKCSFHKHLIKDEVLLLERGMIKLIYGYDEDITKAQERMLFTGDAVHIPPKLIHQMIAIEDSMIFEVSTHHEDSDSIRIVKGD